LGHPTVGDFDWEYPINTVLVRLKRNGNFLIGTTTDAGYKLDVNGTARVQGAVVAQLSSPTSDAFYTVVGAAIGFYTSNSYTKAQKLNLTNALGFPSAPNNVLAVSGSIAASSALAQGVFFNNTLVAAANNDVLVGLDINPTFTNGAFTGVTNLAARIQGNTDIRGTIRQFSPNNTRINTITTADTGVITFTSSAIGTYLQVTSGNVINTQGQNFQSVQRGATFGSTIIGTPTPVRITAIPAQSSGTTSVSNILIESAINNTGTYSGTVRGIYYNPTLTSLTGTTHIAIETVSGNVLFNTTSGNTLIGTTTDSGHKLRVNGTVSAQLTAATQTNQVYYNTTTGELTYGASSGGGAQFVIDYDYNITGVKDGSNTNFSTTVPYKPGTTRVYLNGQRLTPGAEYDYLEISTTQIGMFYAPVPSDRLIIEYETI